MVRATCTAIVAAAILAGGGVAYSAESDSQTAKELAPQQVAECCVLKELEDLAYAKREHADLARQLAAEKAAKNPALPNQRADAEKPPASKESANADGVFKKSTDADADKQSDLKVLIKE
jgi:hypothetical protein